MDERATRKSSVTPASGGRCGSYSWLLAPVVKAAKVPSIDGMTSTVAPLDKVQRSPGDKMHLGPERLRAIITEALAAGTFVVCHDTLTYGDFPGYGPAICRGFYDAYAGQSPALIFLRAWQRITEVPPPGPDSPCPRDAGQPGRPGSTRPGGQAPPPPGGPSAR